jgi:hypothetical protein
LRSSQANPRRYRAAARTPSDRKSCITHPPTTVFRIIAGCTTPYQKESPWNAIVGGYTDFRLDESTFLVSFKGGNLTPVAKLLPYLLYRAAEVTNEAGFDYFQIVESARDIKTGTAMLPGFSQSQGNAVAVGSGGVAHAYGTAQSYSVSPQLLTYQENTITATIRGFKGSKPDGSAVYSVKETIKYLGPQVHGH